jgi:hypothetical protein
MNLELTADEVEALQRLLREYLGDLSYEIADTATSRYRDELRAHREVVQGILERLSADVTPAG